MEFQITPNNSGSMIKGVVGMNTLNLIMMIYFVTITPILAISFRFIPFLAVFFLLIWAMVIGFLRDTLRHRDTMIRIIRKQLTS